MAAGWDVAGDVDGVSKAAGFAGLSTSLNLVSGAIVTSDNSRVVLSGSASGEHRERLIPKCLGSNLASDFALGCKELSYVEGTSHATRNGSRGSSTTAAPNSSLSG